MPESPRSNEQNPCNVDVPLTGFRQPVSVLIAHDFEKLPEGMTILAPDTRRIQLFAAIHRGENVYGSLREEFFVCRSGDFDYNWTVLWVTLNADQAQDSVQRLEPFCMLAAGWRPDGIGDEVASAMEEFDALELEGLILLWAYARYVTASWGKEFLAEAEVTGGLLDGQVAGLVVQAGRSREHLDLSSLGQGRDSRAE